MAILVVVWTMTSILAWYGITKLMTSFPPTTFFLSSLSRIKFPTYSIAHRGGGGENTENTMRAFAHAVHRSKTHMIELDVHLTSDGHVVIFHDANLDRLTGVNKKIHDLKLSELPPLLTSLPRSTFSFDPSPSSSSSSSSSYPLRRFYDIDSSVASVPENGMEQINGLPIAELSNVKIPTLEQVFQAFPDIPINLDVKHYSEELMQKVHSLILRYNRRHLIIWGSFNEKTVSYLRTLDPEIPTFASLKTGLITILYYYLGILPLVPIKTDAFEIPMLSTETAMRILSLFGYAFYPGSSKLRDALWKLLVIFIVRGGMNPAFFSHLQKRGAKVILWTVNTDLGFDLAFNKLKVDGVITDNPTPLVQWLRSSPSPSSPYFEKKTK